MDNQITITWNEAQYVSETVSKEQTENQRKALIDFAEHDFEMLDSRDFEFFCDATGLDEVQLADLMISISMNRVLLHNEVTSKLLKTKNYWYDIKYNPFKKQFMKWSEHTEKWRPARTWELKELLN